MLIAMGALAAICACVAAARKRADQQDALIAWLQQNQVPWYYDQTVSVERWGPDWLELIGADRYRRRIVRANVHLHPNQENEDELFEHLAASPGVRFLSIDFVKFTPRVGAALSDMRHLRELCLDGEPWTDEDSTRECFAAVGKLTRLEGLNLSGWRDSTGDNLEQLAKLKTLKRLSLNIDFDDDADATREYLAAVGKLTQLEKLRLTGSHVRRDDLSFLAGLPNLKLLGIESIEEVDEGDRAHENDSEAASAQLPVLPRLETLSFADEGIGDEDLNWVAALPKLKSLCLAYGRVSGAGLAKLATLQSLEELTINENAVTAASLETLASLKCLRVLHIVEPPSHRIDRIANVTLDGGEKMAVFESELDGVRYALDALRRTHPGIVIDTDASCYYGDVWTDLGEFTPQWEQQHRLDRGLTEDGRQIMEE